MVQLVPLQRGVANFDADPEKAPLVRGEYESIRR
jgi:hypothetical protein